MPCLDCRAAVLFGSNVGDRLGECPVMAGKVLGVVLPLAVHVIGRLVEDCRTSGTGTRAVRPHILDANHDRYGDWLTGGGRAPRRGWLGDDERPGADTHLRAMALADPHMLDRPERRDQPTHRGAHIGIGEHRNDGVRRDRAVGFHGRPSPVAPVRDVPLEPVPSRRGSSLSYMGPTWMATRARIRGEYRLLFAFRLCRTFCRFGTKGVMILARSTGENPKK